MKVLDVKSIFDGIQTILQEITETQAKISAMQRGVRDLVNQEEALKGKAGESIRSFFDKVHQPFLIFFHQSLTDYTSLLTKIKSDIKAYEPSPDGFIHQGFIEHEVSRGLNQSLEWTTDVVHQANQAMTKVSDLVSLPPLNISEFDHSIYAAKNNIREVVEQLHHLDANQTSALDPISENIATMESYIDYMDATFKNGAVSIPNFSVKRRQE